MRGIARRKAGRLGAVLMLWLGALTASSAEMTLNVYVGKGQMPFVGDGEQSRGIFGDLMQELCERIEVRCRLVSVPWKRVQQQVAQDPQGILLNLGRTPAREEEFAWLLNVMPTRYTLASLDHRFDSLEQALQMGPIVVMAGTPRAREALALAREGQRVEEVTSPVLAARMLMNRRVVAWYEIDTRSRYLWKRLGFDRTRLILGTPLAAADSYIAASPLLAEAEPLRERMVAAFAAMEADGSWDRILERYSAGRCLDPVAGGVCAQ